MRVTHIIDSGGFYGAEVMLLNLCVAQQQLGLDVEVISIGTPHQRTKIIEQKLSEAGISVKTWRMYALPDLREAVKILRYCKQNNTAIIHSHGYKSNILLGLLPKFLRPIPVVVTLHGYTQQKRFGKMAINQWLDKYCLKHLDAVVLVSPNMKHQIPYNRLINKLYVVPNGIPILDTSPSKQTYQSVYSNDDYKIGSLGRLSFEKNFSLLIEAMPLVRKEIPRAKLVIYGEGLERAQLTALTEILHLEDCVILPGYLDDTQAFFADIDLFVNCSLTEGMPISLLEAMRQGTPIIATDIPANRYLLENNQGAEYLSALIPNELARKIITLFKKSDAELKQLSQQYIDGFHRNFTSATMAKKYLDIYEAKRVT